MDKSIVDPDKLPKHVAVIMDGNRRWAKSKFLPVKLGHKAGAETFKKMMEWCIDIGIKYLTVYAFSTENWKRNQEEINDIMDLLRNYLKSNKEELNKNGINVKVIGESQNVDIDILEEIREVEKLTKNNSRLFVNIAFNYGSRLEITNTIKTLAKKVLEDKIQIEDIDENMLNNYLYTADVPDPDIVIRTAGEMRVSNFLLWQIAYSEFYFTERLWPDFSKDDFLNAIINYSKRDRRYGGNKKS